MRDPTGHQGCGIRAHGIPGELTSNPPSTRKPTWPDGGHHHHGSDPHSRLRHKTAGVHRRSSARKPVRCAMHAVIAKLLFGRYKCRTRCSGIQGLSPERPVCYDATAGRPLAQHPSHHATDKGAAATALYQNIINVEHFLLSREFPFTNHFWLPMDRIGSWRKLLAGLRPAVKLLDIQQVGGKVMERGQSMGKGVPVAAQFRVSSRFLGMASGTAPSPIGKVVVPAPLWPSSSHVPALWLWTPTLRGLGPSSLLSSGNRH